MAARRTSNSPPARADFAVRLGARVRAVRKSKKRSQMDLVREGWSLGHIGKIERGEIDARASTLKRLADDLGVPVATFFRGL